jgi:hypothetical protein
MKSITRRKSLQTNIIIFNGSTTAQKSILFPEPIYVVGHYDRRHTNLTGHIKNVAGH